MKRRTLPALLTAIAAQAAAQGLPDPTRPPAVVLEAAAAPAGHAAAGAAPSGLQSIIRRQGGRPAAVINGSYVELGGRVGEARLERVGEDSVELRSAGGRETLFLTPGVGKRFAPAESNAAKRPRGKLEKARR